MNKLGVPSRTRGDLRVDCEVQFAERDIYSHRKYRMDLLYSW